MEESTTIKRIPSGQFLYDSGLLFAINKDILHPLGLALEVILNTDDTITIGDLWDYRDDPVGMLYGKEDFKIGEDKYNKFMKEFGDAKLQERKDILGCIVQKSSYYK